MFKRWSMIRWCRHWVGVNVVAWSYTIVTRIVCSISNCCLMTALARFKSWWESCMRKPQLRLRNKKSLGNGEWLSLKPARLTMKTCNSTIIKPSLTQGSIKIATTRCQMMQLTKVSPIRSKSNNRIRHKAQSRSSRMPLSKLMRRRETLMVSNQLSKKLLQSQKDKKSNNSSLKWQIWL